MKQSFNVALAVTLLVCLVFGVLPNIQQAQGLTKTIELTQGTYQGIAAFDLQVGDRVEGSFKVTNLGPYPSLFNEGLFSYEAVDVWIQNPSQQTILKFDANPHNASSTIEHSFNFTATEWGLYSVQTFSGAFDYLKGAKNPVIELNYAINKAVLPQPPNPNVMAWWKLDEGNGSVVADSSWHNYQGTIKGAKWMMTVEGKSVLSFDGNADYVVLPSLSFTNALSVSVWVYSDFTKSGFIFYNGNQGEVQLGNGDLSTDYQN
jgi:hypothetical protein